MNFRFWTPFVLPFLLCLLSVFLFGFFLKQAQFIERDRSLIKQSLKGESGHFLSGINKKTDFLAQSLREIENQKAIDLKSPFFALAIFSLSPLHTGAYQRDKPSLSPLRSYPLEAVYVSEEAFPLFLSPFLSPTLEPANPSKKTEPAGQKADKTKQNLSKKRADFVVRLSQKALGKAKASPVFHFMPLENRFFALFIAPLAQNKWGVAFLKDKNFFKWPAKKSASLEFFAMNAKGRFFFHSQSAKIGKTLFKNSPLRPSLKELSEKRSLKGRYLKARKKRGPEELYYIKKQKEGHLFLAVKQNLKTPFLSKDLFFASWIAGLFLFAFGFVFFSFRLFSLASSYYFLKQAFLSFHRTGLFPSPPSEKNPLLYFYNNRQLFLNKRESEKKPTESSRLTFQDTVREELNKLKSRYPHLSAQNHFDFDVKVFGFERFLRSVIREILLNGLEAMGGLKEQKLNLSLKKEGEHVVFSVRDYGQGVLDKNYKKLFQLYYSTKSQLGAGLNLAQSIVQANGGKVELSSPEGGGLKVCVRLPLKCFLKNC